MPSFQIRIDHEPGNYTLPDAYHDWACKNAKSYSLIARISTGSNHRGWEHYSIMVDDIELASIFKIQFPEVIVEAVFE